MFLSRTLVETIVRKPQGQQRKRNQSLNLQVQSLFLGVMLKEVYLFRKALSPSMIFFFLAGGGGIPIVPNKPRKNSSHSK